MHLLLWVLAGALSFFRLRFAFSLAAEGVELIVPIWADVLVLIGGFWIWLSIRLRLNSARFQGIGYAVYVILVFGFFLVQTTGLQGAPPLYRLHVFAALGTSVLTIVAWSMPGVGRGLKTY